MGTCWQLAMMAALAAACSSTVTSLGAPPDASGDVPVAGDATQGSDAPSGPGAVAEIALGYNCTCARMADATVRCWGYNYFGQLGDGTSTDHNVPTPVVF